MKPTKSQLTDPRLQRKWLKTLFYHLESARGSQYQNTSERLSNKVMREICNNQLQSRELHGLSQD